MHQHLFLCIKQHKTSFKILQKSKYLNPKYCIARNLAIPVMARDCWLSRSNCGIISTICCLHRVMLSTSTNCNLSRFASFEFGKSFTRWIFARSQTGLLLTVPLLYCIGAFRKLPLRMGFACCLYGCLCDVCLETWCFFNCLFSN